MAAAKLLRGVTRALTLAITDRAGEPVSFVGATVKVILRADGSAWRYEPSLTINGNEVSFGWNADNQPYSGGYTIMLIADYTSGNVNRVVWHGDTSFVLVDYSYQEEGDTEDVDSSGVFSLAGSWTVNGASAYEIWLGAGHTGDEDAFLDWLRQPAADEAESVAAAEALRVEAEAGRVSAEQGRVAAETARERQAASDHATAEADHSAAGADHTQAVSDHTQASADHTTAAADHGIAASDHTAAAADHTQAGSDHSRAESDHTTAAADHSQAGTDHTRAEGDHATAGQDHTQAGSDHTTAAGDHTTAAADHTQATADHAVMAGYDTRLGDVEDEVSLLGQKVVYINVGKNLLNLNSPNIITGKYLNSSGGVATGTSDYNISDYIPVKPNTAYCLTNSTDAYIGASGYVAFYDSTKTLTGTPVKTTNFTTPQGASFLRCTFHNSNITDAMLNEGSIRGPYKPYNAIGGYSEEHEDTELRNRLGMAPIPVTEPNKIIDLSGNIGTTIPSPSATTGTWKYYKHTVTAGDIVVVNGTGGSSARLWGFVDNNDKLLDAASGAITGTNLILVAPANAAYVVINDNSGSVSYYMPKDSAFFDIRELGAEKIDVAPGKNLFDANSTNLVSGKYFNSSGAISNGEPYAISDYITIEESTNYTFSKEDGNYAGGSGYMRFYDAYYQPVGSPVANSHFTTPEGAAFVRLSVHKPTDANVMLNKGTIRGQYKPYSVNGKDLVGYGSEIWDSKVGLAQARVIEASLADGGTISIPDYPFFAKWGDNLVFFGKFSSFSKLLVGKGTDKYESIWLEIDATNVVLKRYRSEETTLSTQSHGLTINTYIKVVMSFGIDGKLTYTIQSIGGMFRHTDTNTIWGGMGVCFAQPNGMAMTDCHLSIANNGLRETSWFLGDSYFSVADSRWPYYMLAWGYTKGLWIGLSGGSGFSVEPDFERALNYGRPKFAVYCIGMNDGDDPDVNTPTTRWLDGITAFINACNKYAITPILATIPTVPAKSHEGKNKWVRASGYRYIDFYKAVGADSTGQWYTGYLANDNEHPTVLGGQALATQVLLDFPEIMW